MGTATPIAQFFLLSIGLPSSIYFPLNLMLLVLLVRPLVGAVTDFTYFLRVAWEGGMQYSSVFG